MHFLGFRVVSDTKIWGPVLEFGAACISFSSWIQHQHIFLILPVLLYRWLLFCWELERFLMLYLSEPDYSSFEWHLIPSFTDSTHFDRVWWSSSKSTIVQCLLRRNLGFCPLLAWLFMFFLFQFFLGRDPYFHLDEKPTSSLSEGQYWQLPISSPSPDLV